MRDFLARPAVERRLFVRAACLLGGTRLALWVLPFAATQRLVARLAQPRRAPESPPVAAEEQIVWAVASASKYIPGARRCLPRALVVHILLRREGHPSDLRIGVALDERKKLQAHAWVESRGRVVIGDTELDRYTPLPSLPPP
jgi:hypothetical protein